MAPFTSTTAPALLRCRDLADQTGPSPGPDRSPVPDWLAQRLTLDRRTGYLYATDSALGVIRRARISGGRPVVWAKGPALARTSFVGANGIKVHRGAIWASNLDRRTLLRIPVRRGGSAGAVQIRATGVPIDDFAFMGRGDTVLAALIRANQVAIVFPNGTHRTVLTAANGLSNPTWIAVRGTTIYVPSAAYFTQRDPTCSSPASVADSCPGNGMGRSLYGRL